MFLLEKLWALQRAKQTVLAWRGQGQQVSAMVGILLFQVCAGYDFTGSLLALQIGCHLGVCLYLKPPLS